MFFFINVTAPPEISALPLPDAVPISWASECFLRFRATLGILAAPLSALGLAILTATSRTVALPVAASAITATLGIAAVAMVLLRMIFQPGPNELIDLEFGILLALIASLIVSYGGWESMKEEGTTFDSARDELQSRYARRPAPVRGAPEERRTSAPAPPEDEESRPPSGPPA